MKFRLSPSGLVVLGGLLIASSGCGSQSAEQRKDPDALAGPGYNPNYRPGSRGIPEAAEEADDGSGLVVEAEEGTLDQGAVDRAMERHFRSMLRCYDRAGDAQKYVGGQVTLKFLVASSGQVEDILVTESGLGNYAIERCLVVEGRRIAFPAPRGGKRAQFEYPLRFRSSGEVSVVDWQPDAFLEQVGSFSAQLEGCPKLGPQEVTAVVYISPSGDIDSAGLSSSGPIDPEAGVCALEQMRKWKLAGDAGHMVRTSFPLRVPMAGAPAAALPSKAVARKATRRRR